VGQDAFEDQGETSGRWAMLDTREHSAWLMLTEPTSFRPVADVWVYNLIPPIPPTDIQRYARSGPPPACIGFASPSHIRKAHPDDVTFHWSKDGDAVAIEVDGEVLAFLQTSPRKGWARHLLKEGPFGSPWDDKEHSRLFDRSGP
jgi:hypothetical protein